MDAITMALAELITTKKERLDALNAVAAVNGVMQRHSSLNQLAGYVEGLSRNGYLAAEDPILGDFDRGVKLTWRDSQNSPYYMYLIVHFHVTSEQATAGGATVNVNRVTSVDAEFGEAYTHDATLEVRPAGTFSDDGGAIYASVGPDGSVGSDCILFIRPISDSMSTDPLTLQSVDSVPVVGEIPNYGPGKE